MGLDETFSGAAEGYAHDLEKSPVIVFRFGSEKKTEEGIDKLFTHEMTHIITGHTPHGAWNGYNYKASSYGVERLFEETSAAGRSLNEATTEHFAIALMTGDMDTVRVFRKSGSYVPDRYLLNKLCTMGKEKISPRLFVRALFAGGSPQPGYSYKKLEVGTAVPELQASLERAFPGKKVLEELSNIEEFSLLGGPLSVGGIRKAVKKLRTGRLNSR